MPQPRRLHLTDPDEMSRFINGRITTEQDDYLRTKARDLDVSLSAALRRAIDQSRLLDVARDDPQLRQLVHRLVPVDELDDADDPREHS